MKFSHIAIVVIIFYSLFGCATAKRGETGISLLEAIEESAQRIATELPDGSRVAIVAFESDNDNLSGFIMEEIAGALFDRKIEIADRQNIEYLQRELSFQLSGDVDDQSAQSIGKFLAADMVITGQLRHLGSTYRFTANAIRVETAIHASIPRLSVRNDKELQDMVTALGRQSTTVRTARYAVTEQTVPQTAGTFVDRGFMFASRGDYDMAISDFTDAINLNPNLAGAFIQRGRMHQQKGDTDLAKSDFNEALRLDPNLTAVSGVLVPEGFVYIPGCTFTMGSPASEPGRTDNEGPQRQVTVSSFYMGKYEVTQKEYEEIMGNNPSNFKGSNLPVENVTWFDVIEYCIKRSQREGLAPAYTMTGKTPASDYPITAATVTWNRSANGYRLPTEAEWEYACRAGTTTAYNTGASFSDNTGWYYANSGSKTHEVGRKPANAYGLHDMHGNVWEWCWDWHGWDRYMNPLGPDTGPNRVCRGGSWDDHTQALRSAGRDYYTPDSWDESIGFRLARNAN